ncbi:MAG: hypothetical protein J0H43_08360, partial [Actinobacteria bacterium]|nr:hypothetical protein [Actinomycetota bacterium]
TIEAYRAAVNRLLDSARARAARAIDVGRRLDGVRADTPAEWIWLADDEFGAQVLARAVNHDRVARAVAGLPGQPIEIGPLPAGPRGLASVRATGSVSSAAVTAADRPGVTYDLTVALGLDLDVSAAGRHRYHAEVTLPVPITAHPTPPLTIDVEVGPVDPASVTVDLVAHGAGARLIARAGSLPAQLRRRVASAANKQIAAGAPRTVDLGARIDSSGRREPRAE